MILILYLGLNLFFSWFCFHPVAEQSRAELMPPFLLLEEGS